MTDTPISDCDIDHNNHQTINYLVRSIDLSQHHFSLILIHCNYTFLQHTIFQQFQECCPFEVASIELASSSTSLHSAIQTQLLVQTPQAIMVSGLDRVTRLSEVLLASNYIREEFRNSFRCPILLWVTDAVLKQWIQLAPDLESWTTTFRFKATTDELIQILHENTDHIYRKVLDAGAHGFVPHSLVLDSSHHLEVESAHQELSDRHILLDDELESRVQFIVGLSACSNQQMDVARACFERSLAFTHSHHRLKQEGCVLFYLGLWWRKHAALNRTDRHVYQQSCQQAEKYLRQCINVFRDAQRPDLEAKFINALGEILQRREQWTELEQVAQAAITLLKNQSDLVWLAYAHGLLAEAKSEATSPVWTDVRQIVQQAIDYLDQFESLPTCQTTDEERFLHERQKHRGWYLLLLAKALRHLGDTREAIACLERAQKNGSQLSYHLHIKILETLRGLYFEGKKYQKAFQIKRKQFSIEQQYGQRAFVGAGYLQPYKSTERQPEFLSKPISSSVLASEIEASGRLQDVENLVQKICSPRYKLLTIYGPSGVGKSSLINAGLIPQLEHHQTIRGKQILSPIPVLRKYNKNRWLKDLSNFLKRAIDKQLKFLPPSELTSPNDILQLLKLLQSMGLVTILMFDQFEEFFFTSDDRATREMLYQFLSECLKIASVKVVISIREDCLHYLLECNRAAPLTAIGNDILSQDFLYFLGNLSVDNAKVLIQTLAKRTQVKLDSDLIEALVEDLSSELGEVRPIELQLVGAQLEEEKMTALTRYKSPSSDAKGRIKKLIQAWLSRVIKECGAENEDTAWKVLHQLTHREKIRTIKTQNELMAVSSERQNKLRERQIKCILEVLEGSGVVSKLREDSKHYYQLVHDYLVPYIQDEYARHFDETGQTIKKYKQQLEQDDLVLKLIAVIQMGETAALQAIKPLKQLLDKSETEVSLRWHIFKALSQIKDDEATELLIRKGLEDLEPAVQAHAAHLLGQMSDRLGQVHRRQVSEKLLAKCQNKHRCVRMQSRWAVKQLNLEPPKIEEKANPLLAYILIKGTAVNSDEDDYRRVNQLKSLQLRDTCGVVEGGITCGNYDFLIKVLADNIDSLNELVMGMIPHISWVKLTRTFVVVSEPRLYYWRRPSVQHKPTYISYVWIETSGLNSDSLISSLMDIPEVTEAATVYGGFDVIAKIEAEKPDLRDIVLTQKIARLPFVDSTATYPVIMNDRHSYWDRSDEFKFPEEWLIG